MEEKNEDLTQETEIGSEANCPSCGRFVGPYEKCPYCQAELKKRLSLKLVKRISVIGSIIGLVLLWWASKLKEIPVIKVDTINEMMNNALVRISGDITSVKIDEPNNRFKIKIDDGTGEITLNGFGALKIFRQYFGALNNFPQEGDKVCVTGQLNISEKWGVSMFLKNPKRLEILERYVVVTKKIKDITKDDVHKTFKFNISIEDVNEFSAGKSLEVKDETGSIPLTIFNSQYDTIKDTVVKENLTAVGSEFEIVASIDEYRGNFQLKLSNPADPAKTKFIKAGAASPTMNIVQEETQKPERTPAKKAKKKSKKTAEEKSEAPQSQDEITIQEEK